MNRSHGMSKTPEYRAYSTMINRCRNPNCKYYSDYGGRGITVCDEWAQDPSSFFAYVGPRPSPLHSLDRIDSNKGYEPGNVQWSTKAEQSLHRRNTLKTPGVSLYKIIGKWAAFSPRHPITKKLKWIGCNFYSQDEAVKARADWLQANWPEYPKGRPLTVW